MLREFRSKGAVLISISSICYICLAIVVMLVVTLSADSNNPDSADVVFWTAVILCMGAIVLIFAQFIANMYSEDPANDVFAGLLGVGYFFVVLGVIALFANSFFGTWSV